MPFQPPSLGRIVLFTAFRGHEENKEKVDEYASIITKVHEGNKVDLATFGSTSVYFKQSIPFDSDGTANTWRYPPFVPPTDGKKAA